MLIKKADNNREDILKLLISLKLPSEDLPLSLNNFLIATDETTHLTGVIGLEIYGNYGLLRSLAVPERYGNKGIACKLVSNIEQLAISNHLTAVYLLTETAAEYFKKIGYHEVMRDDVPEEIKTSSEFSHVCPASAIVMKRELK